MLPIHELHVSFDELFSLLAHLVSFASELGRLASIRNASDHLSLWLLNRCVRYVIVLKELGESILASLSAAVMRSWLIEFALSLRLRVLRVLLIDIWIFAFFTSGLEQSEASLSSTTAIVTSLPGSLVDELLANWPSRLWPLLLLLVSRKSWMLLTAEVRSNQTWGQSTLTQIEKRLLLAIWLLVRLLPSRVNHSSRASCSANDFQVIPTILRGWALNETCRLLWLQLLSVVHKRSSADFRCLFVMHLNIFFLSNGWQTTHGLYTSTLIVQSCRLLPPDCLSCILMELGLARWKDDLIEQSNRACNWLLSIKRRQVDLVDQ